MRVAIVNLTGGRIGGGYRKYLMNIMPRLASHPAVESMLCASPYGLNVQDWFDGLQNVNFIGCHPFQFMRHRPDPELSDNLKNYRPDVVFIPLERYLKFDKVPVVTIVRNMEPLAFNEKPHLIMERLRILAQIMEAGIAVKRSNHVIAVSEFVRDFIMRRWKVTDEKVSLIYFGSDMSGVSACRPEEIPDSWQNEFLFTAGSIEPYRGLDDVMSAMKHLKSKRIAVKLVIAGGGRAIMRDYHNKLKETVKSEDMESDILWIGDLDESEMKWCYKNCKAFIMSSRIEACPNTALEAMSNGCVIISSNNPPMPEIFGSAVLYYSSHNGISLAEGLLSILNYDQNTREKISEQTKARAEKFSWDTAAEKTVEILSKVIS